MRVMGEGSEPYEAGWDRGEPGHIVQVRCAKPNVAIVRPQHLSELSRSFLPPSRRTLHVTSQASTAVHARERLSLARCNRVPDSPGGLFGLSER